MCLLTGFAATVRTISGKKTVTQNISKNRFNFKYIKINCTVHTLA